MHFDYHHNSDIEHFSISLFNNEIIEVPINTIKSFNSYKDIQAKNNSCYADIDLILNENFDCPSHSHNEESISVYFKLSFQKVNYIKISYKNNKSKTIIPINHLRSEIRDGKFHLTTIKED